MAAFAIAVSLFCAVTTPTNAYTITVINTNDSGSGLLCQAPIDAHDGDHTMIDITRSNDQKGWICTVGGDFAIAPPSFIRLDDMSDQFIDVSKYGLLSSNTGAQNNAAWLAVKAASKALEITEIRFPAGTFKFKTHGLSPAAGASVAAALTIDTSMTIVGAGFDKTILQSDGWVEPTYSDPQTITTQNDNT
jgi:hypothetical protein